MGVMNPCLERAKWEPSRVGLGTTSRAIGSLLNNGKQPRGCNRVNLVEALRSSLVKSVELGLWSLTYGAQEDGQTK